MTLIQQSRASMNELSWTRPTLRLDRRPIELAAAREDERPRWLGPYRIVSFVRSGGMGEIYRAVDERLGRQVALKALPRRCSGDAHRRRCLLEEGRLLSSVRHPDVCTVHDVGRSRGIDFLVMEYVKGCTLEERLRERPVTMTEAIAIARQTASALEAVHRAGVVHCDVKPANIMLTSGVDDSEPRIKLLDFGLARAIGPVAEEPGSEVTEWVTQTDPTRVTGTWPYMAPEQFGSGEVEPRTDLWALGVVLYEMVCGRRPFDQRTPAALATAILRLEPASPAAINESCSRALSAVIERCLEKDATRRWSSAAELARQLDDRVLLGRDDRRRKVRSFASRVKPALALVTALLAFPMTSKAAEPEARSDASIAEPASENAALASSPAIDPAEMEAMLLRGNIRKVRPLSVGVTGSSKAVVSWRGTTHDAHIQTVDTFLGSGTRHPNRSDSYRYNVAAYRLDRMLGLGMVPVSVERPISGHQAAVTWWVDDVEMMEIERRRLGCIQTDAGGWNDQMQRASIFQELIANSDNNQTNLLITTEWKVWLVDFTRAFRLDRKLMNPAALKRLDPGLEQALQHLDAARLRDEMRGLLDGLQVRSILARRDAILEHFGVGGARSQA